MKLLLAIAAGFLGYCYYMGQNTRQAKGAIKQDLHRWEGEGGNVPTVATPSPPPPSYPPGDDGNIVRH